MEANLALALGLGCCLFACLWPFSLFGSGLGLWWAWNYRDEAPQRRWRAALLVNLAALGAGLGFMLITSAAVWRAMQQPSETTPQFFEL